MLTTQSRLAKKLAMLIRSLKKVLAILESEGIIYRDSVQRGRKSFTVIILNLQGAMKPASLMVHTRTHYRSVPNYLYLDIDLDSSQDPTSRLSELDGCLLL